MPLLAMHGAPSLHRLTSIRLAGGVDRGCRIETFKISKRRFKSSSAEVTSENRRIHKGPNFHKRIVTTFYAVFPMS